MNITIIGAGNMAYFMATRLQKAGYRVSEIYARRKEEAEQLAERVGGQPVGAMRQLKSADAFIFALPDGALKEVSEYLPFKDKVWIHCSGAQPVEVLDTAEAGVIWPLYSINKAHLPSEANIPLFWEAKGRAALEIIPAIAADISTNIRRTDWQKRQVLHLSAVLVNNFVNHLMTLALQLMKGSNLPFKESLQPIIEETVRLALSGEAEKYQTGPAIRKDEQTMERHLGLLSEHPEWQAVYRMLSASIQQYYTSTKKND